MLMSLLRVLVLYPAVIFGIRLMGKRQIGELQPTELVITILISNIATLPIEDQSLPLLAGLVPMLALICFEVLLSWAQLHSKRFRRLLSGSPQVIIRGGKPDRAVMETLRFSLDDLLSALRGCGIFDLSEVDYAVVETNGTVSAYQKAGSRPVTGSDLRVPQSAEPPPEVLITDGCISKEGLAASGMTEKQLAHLLNPYHLRAENVFLLTVSEKKIRTLLPMEEDNG